MNLSSHYCCCRCCRRSVKVLLVLEDVDSLFEGGGDARDRLVLLLSNLYSMGKHLKLLATSEQSLLRETNQRFRDGCVRVRVNPFRLRIFRWNGKGRGQTH